jgi:hypothetical protein
MKQNSGGTPRVLMKAVRPAAYPSLGAQSRLIIYSPDDVMLARYIRARHAPTGSSTLSHRWTDYSAAA